MRSETGLCSIFHKLFYVIIIMLPVSPSPLLQRQARGEQKQVDSSASSYY